MPDTPKHHLATLALALTVLATPAPLMAGTWQPVAAPIVERLETEGYGIIEIRRSWLGRIVILGTGEGGLREIVVNRTTGAVLSDRLFAAAPFSGHRVETGNAGPGEAGSASTRDDGQDGSGEQDADASPPGRKTHSYDDDGAH